MKINIFGQNIGSLAVVPDVTISITGTQTWNGTTDALGYAKDGFGNSPSLKYGSYSVTASKTGYNNATTNFTVPGTSVINMTITPIMTTVEILVVD